MKRNPAKPTRKGANDPFGDEVQAVLAALERRGTKRNRDGMARYAIPSDKAFGVSVGTLKQMAICDTVCFHLFDRTPHAWSKVAQWSGRRDEFVKRAAFAMLWGLSAHDRCAGDEPFARGLLRPPVAEREGRP
jgi:hypothetical protein